jgi:hypothetical protein
MIQGVYMDEFKKCLNYEDALRIISEAKTIAKEIAANSYRKYQQHSIELMMEVLLNKFLEKRLEPRRSMRSSRYKVYVDEKA